MPLAYPPDIVAADFKDGRSLAMGVKRGSKNQPAKGVQSCSLATTEKPSDTPEECAVTEITIEAGGKVSTSYLQPNHAPIPSNDGGRVNFAPKLETATIKWKVDRPDLVTGATIAIFRRGHSTSLWSVKMPVLDLASGTVPYDGVSTATRLLPAGFLNVEHGPFKLKITIEGPVKPGFKEAFTYFDVVIHSITLSWGRYNQLSRGRSSIKGANLRLVTGDPQAGKTGYEELAFNSITTANPAPGAGLQHRVELISNIYAKKPPGSMEMEEYEKRLDFELYRDLWGNGARIPILAKVLVKKSDGTGTDHAPEALAGCRLLWDWQDPNLRYWRNGLTPTAKSEDFLRDIFSQNEMSSPKNVANCPKELGGKLGDAAAPIFRVRDGKGRFPYEVTACNSRKWAAFSKFPTNGTAAQKCATGVVFNPSRIAGDHYNVTCSLYFDQSMDTVNDVTVSAPAMAQAGTFEVYRKIILNYLVRGGQAELGCDPAAIEATIKNTYLTECKMVVDVRRTPVDNNVYKRALKAALDEVEKRPEAYNQIEIMPLVARHLVDMNPPANSPGVLLKRKADFLTDLENTFQAGRLRILTAGGLLAGEEIEGQSSHTKGIPISPYPTKTDTPVKVLVNPGQEFTDGEMVKGEASQVTARAKVAAVKSCWDHTYTEVTSTASKFETTIEVTFATEPAVKIKYAKTGFKRRLMAALSDRGKLDLQAALGRLSTTFNESQTLAITITHKGKDSDNHKERMEDLKGAIDEMLTEGQGMIDRKAYWEKLKKDGWGMLSSEPDYRQRFQKFFVSNLLIQRVVEQYVRLNHQNDEGIFLLHIPGTNNAGALPELARNFKDLALTGIFYGDAFHQDRSKAVTFIATLDPNGPNMYQEPLKSIPSIFAHEAAHAIFLPHAATTVPGGSQPERYKDGCHVQGDNCVMNYDIDSEHFCGLCLLRMRGWDWKPLPNSLGEQEYRIQVELDDVDTLFADSSTSVNGQKQRLQVLGMLNRPLNHPEIEDCFSFSWRHFKTLYPLLEGASSTTVLRIFKQVVTEFLMEGSQLPAVGTFAKIRVPGGYTVNNSQNYLSATMWQHEGQPQAKPYEDFMLGADRFQAENSFYAANPALGKIPLKVTVWRRPKNSLDPWTTLAPGARVYFQLVKPADISTAPVGAPGFVSIAGGKSYQTGVQAPALNGSPLAYYGAKVEQFKPSAGDPDGKNVHKDLGGKRGTTVFAKPLADGFAEIPFDQQFPFAASVAADGRGVARIVFSPSRIGGDTYRLRVFVGPPTQDTNKNKLDSGVLATDPDVWESGTMVRWRTVRVCQNLVMDPAADALGAPADSCKKGDGNLMPNVSNYFGQMHDIDLSGMVTRELARSYCELIIEPEAEQPVSISMYGNDIKTTAIALARRYPRFNCTAYTDTSIHREPMPVVGATGDLQFRVTLPTPPERKSVTIRPRDGGFDSSLMRDETGAIVIQPSATASLANVNVDYVTGQVSATFSVAQTGKHYDVCYHPAKYVDIQNLLDFPATSPFLFNLALPRVYNGRIGPGTKRAETVLGNELAKPALFHGFIDARKLGLVKALLMDATVRGINRNGGFYPGLLFFRAKYVDNYTAIWPSGLQEGKGVGNGIFVFGGTELAAPAFQGLTLHEMSHGLFLMHAPTAPGNKPEQHDAADNYCVMSYDPNDGDHCGQCSATLRGINTRAKPPF